MNNKKCKYCKSEVHYAAQICPNCKREIPGWGLLGALLHYLWGLLGLKGQIIFIVTVIASGYIFITFFQPNTKEKPNNYKKLNTHSENSYSKPTNTINTEKVNINNGIQKQEGIDINQIIEEYKKMKKKYNSMDCGNYTKCINEKNDLKSQIEKYEIKYNINEETINSSKTSKLTAQQLNDLGYEYYKENDYENALKYWKKTTIEYPKFAMGHYNLACVINIIVDREQCGASVSKNEALKHLGLSIKYRKDRWKRMQKDKDLRSLHSSYGYQKLLGIGLTSTKDIQTLLTKIVWRRFSHPDFTSNYISKIKFYGNIEQNYGNFEYNNLSKRIKFKGKYLVNGNNIKLFANKKTFIGNISKKGKLIFENLDTFHDFLNPVCSD